MINSKSLKDWLSKPVKAAGEENLVFLPERDNNGKEHKAPQCREEPDSWNIPWEGIDADNDSCSHPIFTLDFST